MTGEDISELSQVSMRIPQSACPAHIAAIQRYNELVWPDEALNSQMEVFRQFFAAARNTLSVMINSIFETSETGMDTFRTLDQMHDKLQSIASEMATRHPAMLASEISYSSMTVQNPFTRSALRGPSQNDVANVEFYITYLEALLNHRNQVRQQEHQREQAHSEKMKLRTGEERVRTHRLAASVEIPKKQKNRHAGGGQVASDPISKKQKACDAAGGGGGAGEDHISKKQKPRDKSAEADAAGGGGGGGGGDYFPDGEEPPKKQRGRPRKQKPEEG